MSFSNELLSGAAVAALSMSFAGMAQADACDTPSKLGDLGNFAGEVITIAGSMEGKDEEMLLNTVSLCKAPALVILPLWWLLICAPTTRLILPFSRSQVWPLTWPKKVTWCRWVTIWPIG